MRLVFLERVVLVVPFLAVAATTLPAQEVPRRDRAAPLRELFIELDTNGDRVVTADEVPDGGRGAFQILLKHGDRDRDGKLTAEEYRDVLQKAGRSAGRLAAPGDRRNRFGQLDRDGDGKLGPTEVPGGPARLRQLDRDGDKALSRKEFGANQPDRAVPGLKPGNDAAPQGPLVKRLKAMDRDGDGRISRDEFTGRPALFERLDVNRDGFLDPTDRKSGPDRKPRKSTAPGQPS
jgi:Ca2+-binding EF-hand superfamily protein